MRRYILSQNLSATSHNKVKTRAWARIFFLGACQSGPTLAKKQKPRHRSCSCIDKPLDMAPLAGSPTACSTIRRSKGTQQAWNRSLQLILRFLLSPRLSSDGQTLSTRERPSSTRPCGSGTRLRGVFGTQHTKTAHQSHQNPSGQGKHTNDRTKENWKKRGFNATNHKPQQSAVDSVAKERRDMYES